jgi:hypothetical protein
MAGKINFQITNDGMEVKKFGAPNTKQADKSRDFKGFECGNGCASH